MFPLHAMVLAVGELVQVRTEFSLTVRNEWMFLVVTNFVSRKFEGWGRFWMKRKCVNGNVRREIKNWRFLNELASIESRYSMAVF